MHRIPRVPEARWFGCMHMVTHRRHDEGAGPGREQHLRIPRGDSSSQGRTAHLKSGQHHRVSWTDARRRWWLEHDMAKEAVRGQRTLRGDSFIESHAAFPRLSTKHHIHLQEQAAELRARSTLRGDSAC
jgi:hypothetical protein